MLRELLVTVDIHSVHTGYFFIPLYDILSPALCSKQQTSMPAQQRSTTWKHKQGCSYKKQNTLKDTNLCSFNFTN